MPPSPRRLPGLGKGRLSVSVSPENMAVLERAAQAEGGTVAGLCGQAVVQFARTLRQVYVQAPAPAVATASAAPAAAAQAPAHVPQTGPDPLAATLAQVLSLPLGTVPSGPDTEAMEVLLRLAKKGLGQSNKAEQIRLTDEARERWRSVKKPLSG